ncbi:3'(2'),5'-bisphosphate nucleotidase CysQ [Dactylosporangium roseum]|uniref:3'(2'),5'-bisphosphate nucleotidase CysQ n=1 Tax=Dactylosporangium roseum TaxID=47989 RepID=A0ABY5Z9C1_9ACTN|nr:3'(2'),5'-bisphosphate nucleotidase CysQ [Dactylosporangium roseum]UWZ37422.1 3'(2'),5'-bisphosphate nucleotidase CysQ [Dactylosporangium roseum]
MSDLPPATDGGFARWLAQRAGDLLLKLREEMGYADPDALRRAGDRMSHELLMEQLGRWRPADAVLSEEGVDSAARLGADRVWIVDPLDGTREFGEEGRADWAVHVALWGRSSTALEKGAGRLVAGAVALPAQHCVLGSDAPPPFPPMPGVQGEPIRLAASRTRPPALLSALAGKLPVELVPMGSAGAKIAAVIDGAVDAYVHAGGQYEWDSAAPVAVAVATGLHASRIDGTTLEYNQPDPRLPDLVVCRKALAPQLLAAINS